MKKKVFTVLLIEDDPFFSSTYAMKLEQKGYRVYIADDGAKGLRMMEHELPDVVVLDVLLPRLNGFEVLERAKQNKKLAGIPVIMLTNVWGEEDIARGRALGAVEYFIKAHTMPSEVMEVIKKYADIFNSARTI